MEVSRVGMKEMIIGYYKCRVHMDNIELTYVGSRGGRRI